MDEDGQGSTNNRESTTSLSTLQLYPVQIVEWRYRAWMMPIRTHQAHKHNHKPTNNKKTTYNTSTQTSSVPEQSRHIEPSQNDTAHWITRVCWQRMKITWARCVRMQNCLCTWYPCINNSACKSIQCKDIEIKSNCALYTKRKIAQPKTQILNWVHK